MSLGSLLLVPLSSAAAPFGVLQDSGASGLSTGVLEGPPHSHCNPRPGAGRGREELIFSNGKTSRQEAPSVLEMSLLSSLHRRLYPAVEEIAFPKQIHNEEEKETQSDPESSPVTQTPSPRPHVYACTAHALAAKL